MEPQTIEFRMVMTVGWISGKKNPVKRQRNVLIVQTVHRLELMFKKLIAMIVHGTLFLCVVVVTVNHLLKNLQFMMYLFL